MGDVVLDTGTLKPVRQMGKNGAAYVILCDATGTPGGAQSTSVTSNWEANTDNLGIGYTTGDKIRQLQIFDGAGVLITETWTNITTGAVIGTPVLSELNQASTTVFSATQATFMAKAAGASYSKHDLIQRTLLRSGTVVDVFWDNLTQGGVSIAGVVQADLIAWGGDGPALPRPVLSYQNLSSLINLTYPTVVPAAAVAANIAVEGGQVRITTDGTPATATHGQKWSAGGLMSVYGANCQNISIFALTAGAISVEYVG